MINTRELSDHLKTAGSPKYGLTDPQFYQAIGIAAVLMILTVGFMFLFANTPIAEGILFLYELFWFLGVIVVGGILSAGWYIGLVGIDRGSMLLATIGVGISILGYGAFGGAIFSQYDPSLWIPAVGITSVITIGITLLLSTYIFTAKRDLSSWGLYSGGCFLLGAVIAFMASFIQVFQIIAFALILFGFIFELGYEIWLCTRSERKALANGFAIYFAFAGVFVHILQLVFRSLAEN